METNGAGMISYSEKPMSMVSEEWSSCNDALGSAERVLGILAEGRVVEADVDVDTLQRGALSLFGDLPMQWIPMDHEWTTVDGSEIPLTSWGW